MTGKTGELKEPDELKESNELREPNELKESKESGEPAVQLPEAFLEKMRRLLGVEYEAFVKSYEMERAQGLRINTLKGDPERLRQVCEDRFHLKQVPWCREGFYYDSGTRPGRHPFHEAGLYYIQEPSAMAVVSLLDPQPGEAVLDLCAAPGGKTTHIGERLAGCGLLVSNEIHPSRAKILSQNVERMGIRNAVVTNESSERLKACFPEFFDKIVVDAPCSGEGMFRKDEQARAEWSKDHVAMCAERQREILDNAAAMLKPGGRLVYSTCTFSPEENEQGICKFLDRHPNFSAVHISETAWLPGLSHGRTAWAGETNHGDAAADTCRIWPHLAKGEGHYLALLQKLGEQTDGEKIKGQKQKPGKNRFWNDRAGLKTVGECLEGILKQNDLRTDRLLLFGDQVYLLPPGMISVSGLKILRPGLHLGTLKKNRMEPSHALAMALSLEEVKTAIDLSPDSDDIRKYLNGSALQADSGKKGWVLVCVEGYSIGWGKASSGILKNHYPKGLRIQGGF